MVWTTFVSSLNCGMMHCLLENLILKFTFLPKPFLHRPTLGGFTSTDYAPLNFDL